MSEGKGNFMNSSAGTMVDTKRALNERGRFVWDKKYLAGSREGMGPRLGTTTSQVPHRKLAYMPITRGARLRLSSLLQEIELVEDKGASF